MPVKTLTRPASQHQLPALLAQSINNLPFGALAIGDRSAGPKGRGKVGPKGRAQTTTTALAHNVRMAMVGHAYLMGSMALLAQCLNAISGEPSKTRRAWGSNRTHKRRGRKAKAKA